MVVNMDVEPGEPGLSGATAIIVLDGGRIVQVPAECVEPAESEGLKDQHRQSRWLNLSPHGQ